MYRYRVERMKATIRCRLGNTLSTIQTLNHWNISLKLPAIMEMQTDCTLRYFLLCVVIDSMTQIPTIEWLLFVPGKWFLFLLWLWNINLPAAEGSAGAGLVAPLPGLTAGHRPRARAVVVVEADSWGSPGAVAVAGVEAACSLLVAGAGLAVVDVLAARVFAPTVDSLRTQNKNLLDITKISKSYGGKDVQTC